MRTPIAALAAVLLAAVLAAAQEPAPAKPASDVPDAAAQKVQLKQLDEAERAESKSVWQDKKLSKLDKENSLRKIHAEYKRKKDAIRSQMKAERKAKRAENASRRPAQDRGPSEGRKGGK